MLKCAPERSTDNFTAMITSVHNPKIQWIRKLQAQAKERRQEGCFVIEGVRLAEEALQTSWDTHLVLFSEELSSRGLALVDEFHAKGIPVEQVTYHVMQSATETETPQGLLAVLALKSLPLPETIDFLLIPDGIRDPGNLGALLRTAAAAGVQGVLIPPGTTDPFAPKVVRSAMGAHFHLPVQMMEWNQIQALLRPPAPSALFNVYLADAKGELVYTQADFRHPTALVIGGEASGAGSEASKLADHRLHIPMPGGIESLNAAIAAAVLLFEVVRQRS
jgi:TrmH family RNA methyltransferase